MGRADFQVLGRDAFDLTDVHVFGRLSQHDLHPLAWRQEFDVALVDHEACLQALRIADLTEFGARHQQGPQIFFLKR